MPKPKRAIADYFPHFAKSGKTIFILEQQFGNNGYAAWFKLLEMLTLSENHFIDCNKPDEWEYLLAKCRLNGNDLTDILNLLSKLGAIDSDLWKLQVIWSENFVNNLEVLYNRRAIKPLNKTSIVKLFTNIPLSGNNVAKNPLSGNNANNLPQSIEKKRRVYVDPMNGQPDNTINNQTELPDIEPPKIKPTNGDVSGITQPNEWADAIGVLQLSAIDMGVIKNLIKAGCVPEDAKKAKLANLEYFGKVTGDNAQRLILLQRDMRVNGIEPQRQKTDEEIWGENLRKDLEPYLGKIPLCKK